MKSLISLIRALSLISVVAFSSSASASLLRLDATRIDPTFSAANFWLEFNDNGDGFVQRSEVTKFSGIAYDPNLFSINDGIALFDTLWGTPNVPGVSIYEGFSTNYSNYWVIGTQTTLYWAMDARVYDYSISSVPEPGSLVLLGLALAGLAAIRQKMS